jgi:hypothetical protein
MVIKLVEWPIFDQVILFLIGVNCVLLTIDDPICKCANSDQCVPWDAYNIALYGNGSIACSNWPTIKAILDLTEIIFTSLFTAEVLSHHHTSRQ